MGYVWSRPAAVPVASGGARPDQAKSVRPVPKTTVRPDQITPEFLAGVRGVAVTLDCRSCAYDDDKMQAVCEAAGGLHRVTLHL